MRPSVAIFLPALQMMFLLFVALGHSSDAGEPATGDRSLCTFEEGAGDLPHKTANSAAVPQARPEGGTCLCWTVEPGQEWFAFSILMKDDLSRYSTFSFLAKSDEEIPGGTMSLRVETSEEDRWSAPLPFLGTQWRRVSVALRAFEPMGKPDPKNVREICIVGWSNERRISLCLDDFVLESRDGGWNAVACERMDFEDPVHVDSVEAGSSEVRPGPGDRGTTGLVWTIPLGQRTSWMDLKVVPRDVRPFQSLRFRIKADTPIPAGRLHVRFNDDKDRWLGTALREVPDSWTTVTVPLGYMRRSGDFDPGNVAALELLMFRTTIFAVSLDDVELLPGTRGPESWKPASDPLLDFGEEDRMFTVGSEGGVVRSEVSGRDRRALVWEIPATKDWVRLTVGGTPADIRPYGAIRLTLMASRNIPANTFVLKVSSSYDDYLEAPLPAIWTQWAKLELPLPSFSPHKSVDPEKIRFLRFVAWDLEPATIKIRSIEFVKGPRRLDSWKPTDAELRARIFDDRARKVTEAKTEHFVLWTDSRAALGKFLGSLEPMYAFVVKTLGLPGMEDRLPIYIFQNETGYQSFCVNYAGYGREQAEHIAGHGCARYFATFFTEPNDPVVAHELTHSIVHRTLGPHGGSWLQEGFAVYVESAYAKGDAAKQFAPILRSGRFTPLAEFLRIEALAFVDAKKDPSKASQLYLQAGAFFAFLKEGPLADRFEELVAALTKSEAEPEDRAKILVKITGSTLDQIEALWREWGGKR